jgi:branched-chain amino acid transport system ATP-binding protein
MEELRVSDMSLKLEGIQILSEMNLTIERGRIHSLIGPNGSGKTSLMNCVTGYYRPNQGSVLFKGREITHLKPHKIAKTGISRMFQHIEIVRELSVIDNIMLGRHMHFQYNPVQALLFYGKALKEELKHRHEIEETLSFLQLDAFKYRSAGSLPYGTQKRIELARALVARPEVLILDEPTSGMNRQEKEEIIQMIIEAHRTSVPSIILIEHDMRIVMEISDIISVMNFGVVIAEGTPKEIQQNDLVIEAYLGAKEGNTCRS